MRRTLLLSIPLLMLIAGEAARAAPPQIKGQYAFTGSAHCLVSGTPFAANLTPTSFTVSLSFSVVGVRTFNGNGTGTIKASAVSINPPPVTNTATIPPTNPLGGISASSSDFTAQFTYVVDGDGGITTNIVPGSFFSTTTSGTGAGSTSTIDNFSLAGMISEDKKTIMLASVEPMMETQTITPTSGAPFVRYRICHRSRVLTWLGEGKGKN